jgi:hypothetical protein
MKISELLREGEEDPKRRKSSSALPGAPSIDDEPVDVERDDDGNAAGEFKQDAVAIGGGIYALSAWTYPEAWTGGGSSDILMHRITTLADDLGADIGDYESTDDDAVSNGRRLEVVFYNEQTHSMFRLSASGSDGTVQFIPALADLQQSGELTGSQIAKIRSIEATVQRWCDAVPEEAAVRDARGRPNTRSWRSAEDKVTGLFDFSAADVAGDDELSDPNSSAFWRGLNTRPKLSPEIQAKSDEFMKQLIARKRAEIEAKKAAEKSAGAGRGRRK